jgi:hypothetical protein
MFISSLEDMEKIVSERRYLHWDGWVVVQTFPSDKARTSKFGLLRNGRWCIQKRFVPGKQGWNISEKILIVKKEQRESK